MRLESMAAKSRIHQRKIFSIALIAAIFLVAAPTAQAASGSGSTGPSHAVKFESIPGSTVKRVILTAKASKRLGIEIGKVAQQRIVRKQMVGGVVTHPLIVQAEWKKARRSFGSFGLVAVQSATKQEVTQLASPTPSAAWVRVSLSQEEWDRVVKDKPARILPLATRDKLAKEVMAKPSKWPPLADVKRSMLALFYVVHGQDHGLKENDRMRVELQLSGSDKLQKVTPYSSLYYDGKGDPWVYVRIRPLVFERKSVIVERIVGKLAVLNSGPAVGTEVVTVGAALLYGAEVVFKR